MRKNRPIIFRMPVCLICSLILFFFMDDKCIDTYMEKKLKPSRSSYFNSESLQEKQKRIIFRFKTKGMRFSIQRHKPELYCACKTIDCTVGVIGSRGVLLSFPWLWRRKAKKAFVPHVHEIWSLWRVVQSQWRFCLQYVLYMMVRPYCISVQMGKNKRRPTLRSIFDWTCSVVWPTGKCLSFVRYQSLFPPFQTLARVKADVQQDGRLYVSWTSGREDPLNCSSLVNI